MQQTYPSSAYIDDKATFDAFARRAAEAPLLAIDTEFLREKTYYPKLCLIQLATPDEAVVVDPFAVRDMSALTPVLRDPAVVKLFHAGGQDLEIINREFGVIPQPIFDTQVAGAVLGYAQQIGYGALVHSLCGVTLKKSDSFSDWSQRPLSKSQIEYAADDVIYLPTMYRIMVDKLEAKGRLNWLTPDFEAMTEPERYEVKPRERYRRLKRVSQLSRRQLSAAREVAAWREEIAVKSDIPRKWVLTDEQIVEACRREATTVDSLFLVRGVKEKLNMREAREIVALIKKGLSLPEKDLPPIDRPTKSEPNVDAALDLMEAVVRVRAKENEIAPQTLASRDDLAQVARGHVRDVDVLKGWRRRIVGEELLDLIAGKLTLSLHDNTLVISRQ